MHIKVEQEYAKSGESLNKNIPAIKFFTDECRKNNICPRYPIVEKLAELRALK